MVFLVPCVGTVSPVLVYYIAVHVQGCGKGTCMSFSMFQSQSLQIKAEACMRDEDEIAWKRKMQII